MVMVDRLGLIERVDAARAAVERLEHVEGRAAESRMVREALTAVIACFDVPPATDQGAVDDLGKIGHAFLAYEHAPPADQGEYRAELLAVVREVVNRRAGGQ